MSRFISSRLNELKDYRRGGSHVATVPFKCRSMHYPEVYAWDVQLVLLELLVTVIHRYLPGCGESQAASLQVRSAILERP
jgi:hypothetical protein